MTGNGIASSQMPAGRDGQSGRFATTRWSVVCAAGREDSVARAALASLCETYWYALYVFLRRRGCSREEAEDVVQAFFARLLERGWVRSADRDRGRFRTFLLTALVRFLGKERDRQHAARRGGGRMFFSLDFDAGELRYQREPVDQQTPDRLFDRRWAMTVLDRVLARLEDEHADTSTRAAKFAALKPLMTAAPDADPYATVAASLDMTEAAVKVAVHRLRKRYKELLRDEVAQTVSDPASIEQELADLRAALQA